MSESESEGERERQVGCYDRAMRVARCIRGGCGGRLSREGSSRGGLKNQANYDVPRK